MNARSEALAARLEAGATALAAFAATLSETEWETRVPHDGRKVGVVVHHVASVCRSSFTSRSYSPPATHHRRGVGRRPRDEPCPCSEA
jgi:hypothetical protein